MAEVVLHGTFSIDTFDPATTEWKRWLQRFPATIKIFNVPDERRVLYLLHYIGSAAFDVICNRMASADPYASNFDDLTTSLGSFYAPEPLEIAENFRFYQRKQKEEESIKDYVAALHKLSVHYNFGTYLKTALRNQFVFGLRSHRAQSRLLETRDLTFEKAVQVAMAMELSEKDTKQLQSGTAVVEYLGTKANKKIQRKKKPTANPEKGKTAKQEETTKHSVDKVQNNTSISYTNSKISCFRCGGNHLANKCTLNRNIKCNNCGTPGHLRKVCMGSKLVTTNQIEEVFVAEHAEHRDKFCKVFNVEGQSLRFEIDSGAAILIVSVRTVRKLFPLRHLQPTIDYFL